MDTKITKDPIVTSKMPSPSIEDMAFSEYNVFNVSVQLKLEARDFSFLECGDSVFGIIGADTSELGVDCVGSVYLSDVIKFVPQDMQKESATVRRTFENKITDLQHQLKEKDIYHESMKDSFEKNINCAFPTKLRLFT